VFYDAYSALMDANMLQGSCDEMARSSPVDSSISLMYRSVMGVTIPIIKADDVPPDIMPYGAVGTSFELDEAYVKFSRAKSLVKELAETENTIYRLAYSIKKTQKRANALKNVVIPRLDADILRITDSLEEKEREEFVRQKIIKSRK